MLKLGEIEQAIETLLDRRVSAICGKRRCSPALCSEIRNAVKISTSPQRITFREAHHHVGNIVRLSEQLKMPLNVLVGHMYGSKVAAEVFDVEKAMARRNLIGAPGHRQCAKQLVRWGRTLRRSTSDLIKHRNASLAARPERPDLM